MTEWYLLLSFPWFLLIGYFIRSAVTYRDLRKRLQLDRAVSIRLATHTSWTKRYWLQLQRTKPVYRFMCWWYDEY